MAYIPDNPFTANTRQTAQPVPSNPFSAENTYVLPPDNSLLRRSPAEADFAHLSDTHKHSSLRGQDFWDAYDPAEPLNISPLRHERPQAPITLGNNRTPRHSVPTEINRGPRRGAFEALHTDTYEGSDWVKETAENFIPSLANMILGVGSLLSPILIDWEKASPELKTHLGYEDGTTQDLRAIGSIAEEALDIVTPSLPFTRSERTQWQRDYPNITQTAEALKEISGFGPRGWRGFTDYIRDNPAELLFEVGTAGAGFALNTPRRIAAIRRFTGRVGFGENFARAFSDLPSIETGRTLAQTAQDASVSIDILQGGQSVGVGTGTFIGRNRIQTAAHVLIGADAPLRPDAVIANRLARGRDPVNIAGIQSIDIQGDVAILETINAYENPIARAAQITPGEELLTVGQGVHHGLQLRRGRMGTEAFRDPETGATLHTSTLVAEGGVSGAGILNPRGELVGSYLGELEATRQGLVGTSQRRFKDTRTRQITDLDTEAAFLAQQQQGLHYRAASAGLLGLHTGTPDDPITDFQKNLLSRYKIRNLDEFSAPEAQTLYQSVQTLETQLPKFGYQTEGLSYRRMQHIGRRHGLVEGQSTWWENLLYGDTPRDSRFTRGRFDLHAGTPTRFTEDTPLAEFFSMVDADPNTSYRSVNPDYETLRGTLEWHSFDRTQSQDLNFARQGLLAQTPQLRPESYLRDRHISGGFVQEVFEPAVFRHGVFSSATLEHQRKYYLGKLGGLGEGGTELRILQGRTLDAIGDELIVQPQSIIQRFSGEDLSMLLGDYPVDEALHGFTVGDLRLHTGTPQQQKWNTLSDFFTDVDKNPRWFFRAGVDADNPLTQHSIDYEQSRALDKFKKHPTHPSPPKKPFGWEETPTTFLEKFEHITDKIVDFLTDPIDKIIAPDLYKANLKFKQDKKIETEKYIADLEIYKEALTTEPRFSLESESYTEPSPPAFGFEEVVKRRGVYAMAKLEHQWKSSYMWGQQGFFGGTPEGGSILRIIEGTPLEKDRFFLPKEEIVQTEKIIASINTDRFKELAKLYPGTRASEWFKDVPIEGSGLKLHTGQTTLDYWQRVRERGLQRQQREIPIGHQLDWLEDIPDDPLPTRAWTDLTPEEAERHRDPLPSHLRLHTGQQTNFQQYDQMPNAYYRVGSRSENPLEPNKHSISTIHTDNLLYAFTEQQQGHPITTEQRLMFGLEGGISKSVDYTNTHLHQFVESQLRPDALWLPYGRGYKVQRKGVYATPTLEDLTEFFGDLSTLNPQESFRNTIWEGMTNPVLRVLEGEKSPYTYDLLPEEHLIYPSRILHEETLPLRLDTGQRTGELSSEYIFKFFTDDERKKLLHNTRTVAGDYSTQEAVSLLNKHYPKAESLESLFERASLAEKTWFRAHDLQYGEIGEHRSYDLSLTRKLLEADSAILPTVQRARLRSLQNVAPDAYIEGDKVMRQGIFATRHYSHVEQYLTGMQGQTQTGSISEGGNLLHVFRGAEYPRNRHLEDYESVVNPEREIYRIHKNMLDLNEGYRFEGEWYPAHRAEPPYLDAPAELFAVDPRRRFLLEERPFNLRLDTGTRRMGMEHVTRNRDTFEKILNDNMLKAPDYSPNVFFSMGPHYRNSRTDAYGFIFPADTIERFDPSPYAALGRMPEWEAFKERTLTKDLWEYTHNEQQTMVKNFIQSERFLLEKSHDYQFQNKGYSEFVIEQDIHIQHAGAIIDAGEVKMITPETRIYTANQWEFRSPTQNDWGEITSDSNALFYRDTGLKPLLLGDPSLRLDAGRRRQRRGFQTLYHATRPENVQSILEHGLDPARSRGTRQANYLFTASREGWARDHVTKKFGIPQEDVSIFEVTVPRASLTRFQRGLWWTPQAITPENLRLRTKGLRLDTGTQRNVPLAFHATPQWTFDEIWTGEDKLKPLSHQPNADLRSRSKIHELAGEDDRLFFSYGIGSGYNRGYGFAYDPEGLIYDHGAEVGYDMIDFFQAKLMKTADESIARGEIDADLARSYVRYGAQMFATEKFYPENFPPGWVETLESTFRSRVPEYIENARFTGDAAMDTLRKTTVGSYPQVEIILRDPIGIDSPHFRGFEHETSLYLPDDTWRAAGKGPQFLTAESLGLPQERWKFTEEYPTYPGIHWNPERLRLDAGESPTINEVYSNTLRTLLEQRGMHNLGRLQDPQVNTVFEHFNALQRGLRAHGYDTLPMGAGEIERAGRREGFLPSRREGIAGARDRLQDILLREADDYTPIHEQVSAPFARAGDYMRATAQGKLRLDSGGQRYLSEHMMDRQYLHNTLARGYLSGEQGNFTGALYFSEGAHYRRPAYEKVGFLFNPNTLEDKYGAVISPTRMSWTFRQLTEERLAQGAYSQEQRLGEAFRPTVLSEIWQEQTGKPITDTWNIQWDDPEAMQDYVQHAQQFRESTGVGLKWMLDQHRYLQTASEPEFLTMQRVPIVEALAYADETGPQWITGRSKYAWDLKKIERSEMGGLEPGSFVSQGETQSIILHSGDLRQAGTDFNFSEVQPLNRRERFEGWMNRQTEQLDLYLEGRDARAQRREYLQQFQKGTSTGLGDYHSGEIQKPRYSVQEAATGAGVALGGSLALLGVYKGWELFFGNAPEPTIPPKDPIHILPPENTLLETATEQERPQALQKQRIPRLHHLIEDTPRTDTQNEITEKEQLLILMSEGDLPDSVISEITERVLENIETRKRSQYSN